jgi:hypothetical protein
VVSFNKEDPFSSPLSPLPAARYSLRDRGGSSVGSTSRKSPSPGLRRSRAPPPRAPVVLTKPQKKVFPADPLGALLKEKQRADKDGKGRVAFRLAEDAMRAGSPLSEDSDEGEPADWTNEAAARAAVKSQINGWGTSSPGPSDGDEVSLNDEDRCRLLGEKRGKAVVSILANDRAKKEAAMEKQKVLGVPLWEDDSTRMYTDPAVPSLPDHLCGQPVFALFKSSIQSGSKQFEKNPRTPSSYIIQTLHRQHYCSGLASSPTSTCYITQTAYRTSATSVCSGPLPSSLNVDLCFLQRCPRMIHL